jgi:magnesium transporter
MDNLEEIFISKDDIPMMQFPQSYMKRALGEFRVHILDMEGKFIEKVLNKIQIVSLTGLNSRNIRLHLPNQPIGIFVHDRCIIVNMFSIKMIILSDQIIIYDYDKHPELKPLIRFLQQELGKNDDEMEPFEFLILEIVLNFICESVIHQYDELNMKFEPILNSILELPTQKKSMELLPIKHEFKKFEVSTQSIHDSLDKLLEDDDMDGDMHKMYLTKKEQNNQYVEDLLETYYFKIDETLDKINILKNNIEETDDTVEMVLNINRNSIMKTDVWNNFFNLALSLGSFVTVHFATNFTFPGKGGYAGWKDGWMVIFGVSWSMVIIPIIIFKIFFSRHKL